VALGLFLLAESESVFARQEPGNEDDVRMMSAHGESVNFLIRGFLGGSFWSPRLDFVDPERSYKVDFDQHRSKTDFRQKVHILGVCGLLCVLGW
jgi:hypothetical protein